MERNWCPRVAGSRFRKKAPRTGQTGLRMARLSISPPPEMDIIACGVNGSIQTLITRWARHSPHSTFTGTKLISKEGGRWAAVESRWCCTMARITSGSCHGRFLRDPASGAQGALEMMTNGVAIGNVAQSLEEVVYDLGAAKAITSITFLIVLVGSHERIRVCHLV